MKPLRPIKLWCVVEPDGEIVLVQHSARECQRWLCGLASFDPRARARTLRRRRREGWRVRRLRPEEVAP